MARAPQRWTPDGDPLEATRDRRGFVSAVCVAGAALVIGERLAVARTSRPVEVNATEDLMREHGLLRRVLLIYAEAARRMLAHERPPADAIGAAAGITRRFVEGYHERLEERFVFPRFDGSKSFAPLVKILRTQHDAGRRLTAQTLELSTPAALAHDRNVEALVVHLQTFQRMYEPHAAREDTDLFPSFHALFSEREFDRLSEQFEEEERHALGSGGFEATVKEVGQLEEALGLHALEQFTPR